MRLGQANRVALRKSEAPLGSRHKKGCAAFTDCAACMVLSVEFEIIDVAVYSLAGLVGHILENCDNGGIGILALLYCCDLELVVV